MQLISSAMNVNFHRLCSMLILTVLNRANVSLTNNSLSRRAGQMLLFTRGEADHPKRTGDCTWVKPTQDIP